MSTELAMHTGIIYLKILSPFYFVVSAKLVADGILRGAGLMKNFMVATFTDLILRVVLAFVFSKTALGATGIWCAWPVGWLQQHYPLCSTEEDRGKMGRLQPKAV